MAHNSQSKNSKSSMYLKKNIDNSFPNNITVALSNWIDCYNSNIREKTKIGMHYEFDNKINDTSIMTSKIQMSKSGKRSETERYKYEKEIFNWLATLNEQNLEFYSDKIHHYIKIDKKSIISQVNISRLENGKTPFDPNYKLKKITTPVPKIESKPEEKEEKKEEVVDKNGKVFYGDSWDL